MCHEDQAAKHPWRIHLRKDVLQKSPDGNMKEVSQRDVESLDGSLASMWNGSVTHMGQSLGPRRHLIKSTCALSSVQGVLSDLPISVLEYSS